MTSRQSKRDAARAAQRSSRRGRWFWPIVGGGVLVAAAIAAIVLTSGGPTGGSSARPTGSPAASLTPGSGPVVTGAALPVFEPGDGDPAIGLAIPTVEGASFDGTPVAIATDGRPKVLLFLAHWCPHCQAEVPVVQGWIDGGGAPVDVDLISIVTAIDPNRPNYPPEAWLAREHWTVPVIVDPSGSVADAYGLSAFPYWVFVDAEGRVASRRVGELSIADLETVIAELAR